MTPPLHTTPHLHTTTHAKFVHLSLTVQQTNHQVDGTSIYDRYS